MVCSYAPFFLPQEKLAKNCLSKNIANKLTSFTVAVFVAETQKSSKSFSQCFKKKEYKPRTQPSYL
jgi:hypothetical protein